MTQTDLFVQIPYEDDELPDWVQTFSPKLTGKWFHVEPGVLENGGRITNAYSADIAAETRGGIRRPFSHKGFDYTVMSMMHNQSHGILAEAWVVVPVAHWKGAIYKYGERAHHEPHRGDHTGEKVFSGPVEYIMKTCHCFWTNRRAQHVSSENVHLP